jgi:hypothetical protein
MENKDMGLYNKPKISKKSQEEKLSDNLLGKNQQIRVCISIDVNLHKKLKHLAVEQGKSISEILRDDIESLVSRDII